MNTVHLDRTHSHSRSSYFYFALRIVTGFILLLKGIYFISHAQELQQMVIETNADLGTRFMLNYVTWAHLIGGAFIILGLLTRVAVILQLPIIIGALYFNIASSAFGTGTELILSILLFGLLIYILVKGAGYLSMDHYLKRHLL